MSVKVVVVVCGVESDKICSIIREWLHLHPNRLYSVGKYWKNNHPAVQFFATIITSACWCCRPIWCILCCERRCHEFADFFKQTSNVRSLNSKPIYKSIFWLQVQVQVQDNLTHHLTPLSPMTQLISWKVFWRLPTMGPLWFEFGALQKRLRPLFNVWAPKLGPPVALVAHTASPGLPPNDLHFANFPPKSELH